MNSPRLRALLFVTLLGTALRLSAATSADRITGGLFFGERIVQVGPQSASEVESRLVLDMLNLAAANQYANGLNNLEEYLAARTNSPWAPSLHAVLGKHYHSIGRDTLALQHWEAAWTATADYPDGNGKRVADFVLAHWTRLLARLGRYEALTVLFEANRSRVLDRGHLSQMWARTREAVAQMRLHPGLSYQCGMFALNAVAREMRLQYDARALLSTPSPATGFSLETLVRLSDQLQLGLVPVARITGEELPVPSVVHWRQNHYAAIVSRQGGFYSVVDPTFGYPRLMTAETLNAEASGNFLAPANRVPNGYRPLTPAETGVLFGRGNPNWLSDGDDQGCGCDGGECPPGSDGPGGSGSGGPGGGRCGTGGCASASAGMAVWRVSEPYINLWLEDEPLGYQTALGSRVSFTLKFKQRSENEQSKFYETFSNVGLSWNCSWLSSINSQYGSYGWATVYYADGGIGNFDFGFHTTNTLATNYYNNLKPFVVTNTLAGGASSYEILYPNGAKDVYGFNPTNQSGYGISYFYLSQKTSPEGQTTTFQYEDYDPYVLNIRLKYVIDPDGRTNTLSYAIGGFSDNLITQVTDPFGRATYLGYDTNGLLTSITDVAGLASSIGYNELGWVTNLTRPAPYGQTSFDPVDLGAPGSDIRDRTVTITEANNSKQLYVFLQFPLFEPDYLPYAAAAVPTNTPIGTLENNAPDGNFLWGRYSYHWGRLQYAALSTNNLDYLTSSDYLKGHMRHWLGATVHGALKSMDTLSLERTPSPDGTVEGQKTWYDYPNKGAYGTWDKGDHILPGVIARVLPDGSTWYQWKRRNEWGWPTNTVETYTQPDGSIGLRTNTFIYAANGNDLVLYLGPQNEQVVSNYFGSAYHQPDASYDALNQETRYTYNASRQLTSRKGSGGLTTTNIYFPSGSSLGHLDKTIDLEIKRTNSYTYLNGLVYSHTDERGLTVTNYWDNLQRLTGEKYPDGTTTSNRYTALDVTARKDRLGNWAYTGFNAIRQPLAETNANNTITRYGYCECGALLSVTNGWNSSAQLVTSFGYDNQGNRVFTYYPDATVTNWFDALGRGAATGDAWATNWFGYNNQGLVTSITNAYGAQQRTAFDIEDRPIYVTDANNVTITNTYDLLGRLRTRTAPDGGAEKFGYSARGLVAYTNQLSATNFYVYDEAGRKTFETNANSELMRYTNSAAGDLLSLTDGKTQTTRWNYDEYGRVTNKLDQAGTEILRYKYDQNKRLTNRWSIAKTNTYYQYDFVGNLTNIDYPVSTDVRFQYDALNRVTNMVDAAGTTIYSYAAGGQLWTEDGPWASDTVTNSYSNRLRTGLSLAQAAGSWTNAFKYDGAKRLTNVTSQAGAFNYYLGAAAAASPLAKKLALPNTAYITNTYDTVARLTGTWLKTSTNGTLGSATYGYNVGNQRTTFTNAAGTFLGYTYDKIGQLKVADSSVNSEDRRYVYDAAWNLNYRTNNTTTYTFNVDGKNQLTNGTLMSNQAYDGNGNLTFGRTSSSSSEGYSYDDENQLANWYSYGDKSNGNGQPITASDLRTEFVYDGKGRLRKRLEYTATGAGPYSWALSATTTYIYDGMRVIQERNASNVPQVSYTRGSDLSGSLEGAGGIGGLLGRSHAYQTGSGNWTNHNFYHADGNGNVTYLVSSSQALAASYRYDPFGNTTASSGTLASANVYRFSSKEIHVNSGLYYYGYRWYAPSLQRWQNRDPMEEIDGPNLYLFVGNIPLSRYDAFGHNFGCQRDPCANACADAKTQHLDQDNPAGTVCCGGKKIPCVWDANGGGTPVDPTAKKIIKSCLQAHENNHVNDPSVTCPPGNGLQMATGGPQSECSALRAQRSCLRFGFRECAGNPTCIRDMIAEQQALREVMERKHCP